jgi:hypothetical protein
MWRGLLGFVGRLYTPQRGKQRTKANLNHHEQKERTMNGKTLAGVLLVVFLLAACSSNVTPDTPSTLQAQAGAWEFLGLFTDSSPNGSTTVATDGTNIFTAYPTYNESSGCLDIRVKKWSGSSWTNVGSDLNGSSETGAFQNCHAYYPSLALNNSGNPVIAWLEEAGSAINVYVQRFNGTTWENLTPLGFAANNNQFYPSLALDSLGNPVVAWRKDYGIYVAHFNGTSWVNLVSDLRTPDGSANNPTLAIDPSDNPVLAWDSINNFGTVTNIYVQRYNGSSWEDVGGPLGWSYPNGGWSRPSLAVDSTGNPTIAWDSYDGSVLNIYVRRFDASRNTWVNVGSGDFLSASSAARSNAQFPSLVLDSSGNPIVAWQEFLGGGNSWNIYVHRYTGSAWINVGSTPDTPVDPTLATAYGSPSLALSSTGNLAVAYEGGGWVHVSRYVTTLPGIAINVSPEPNAAGWNNSDVTVSFSSPDPSATCTPSVTVSAETSASGQVVSGTCTDSAGNSSSNSVTVKLDENGATYTSTPTVGCSSTDTLSGIAAEVTPTISDNGGGSFTATCTNTDRAGNGSSASVTYTVSAADTTAPTTTIILSAATPDGSNGWYKTPVTATVSSTDTDVAETRCVLDPASVPVSFDDLPASCAYAAGSSVGDGQHTLYAASIDNAGNKETLKSATFKVDTAAPTATATASPAANGNGWNNTNVTVSFSGTDALSGVAGCLGSVTLSGEGATQNASGTCTDNAGNVSSPASVSINLDKTAPSVSVTGISNGASYPVGSVPTAACNTQDVLSGVATQASVSVSGVANPPTGAGTYTATCSGAVDNAGNTAANVSVTYTVTSGGFTFTGFFDLLNPPALNARGAGSTAPIRFSLGGDRGLNILAAGSPTSRQISCTTPTTVLGSEEAALPRQTLKYDSVTKEYKYLWETKKVWKGTCREFILRLTDGSVMT